MYRLAPFGIQREDGAFIPDDPGNSDYMAYLAWLDEGNEPGPLPEQEQAVPQSVSRYQARAALLEADLLDSVEAYFASLPESSLAKLAWHQAPTVNRGSEALQEAAVAMGLTDGQLDALFMRAAQFA